MPPLLMHYRWAVVRLYLVSFAWTRNADEVLPVWNNGAPVAWFVDLSIDGFHRGTAVRRAQGNMGGLRAMREMVRVAVRINVAAVHRWVQGSDASVGVLLVGAEGAADHVLDLSILPLFCLLLPKLPHLGLYSVTDKIRIIFICFFPSSFYWTNHQWCNLLYSSHNPSLFPS